MSDECGVLPAWQRWFLGARQVLGVRMWGVHIGLRQPNDTLAGLCDDVRGLDEFLDPGDMADVLRVL